MLAIPLLVRGGASRRKLDYGTVIATVPRFTVVVPDVPCTETCTVMGVVMVTVAACDFVPSATEVAVSMTVAGVGTTAGAM